MPPDPACPAPLDELDRAFERHRAMVRRALAQLGVEPSALEDATQDVFVVLVRRIADFDRSRSWTNWLWGIAKGVAAGYRRSHARRRRLAHALPEPEGGVSPDEALARRRAAQTLESFLATLDAERCAVFVLSEIEGCSGPEIAARLGVNLNTAYARLRAARARFDRALGRARPSVASWWLMPQRFVIGHIAASLVIAPVVARAPADSADEPAPAESALRIEEVPPRAPSPARSIGVAPPPVAEEEIVLVDEPEPPRRVSRRSRPARAEPQPQPPVVAVDAPLIEFVAPSRVELRLPVRPSPLVTVRASFVDRLQRLERDL
jgi:RNA polymerase sigma-70 factor (ECF subfamily)